jgi:putative ABC transport system permease protein
LLRALGVTPSGVAQVFLIEATLIAVFGGLMGIAGGLGIGALIRLLFPSLPFEPSPPAIVAALVMSFLVGLSSGYLPARRAAGLDPVEALRAE